MKEPQTLNNQYRLETEMGRGPMATVYRAIDLESDQPVVVKVFQSRFQTDPGFTIRFREHLKVLVEVDHDNLVTILDYGLADDLYYIVMEAHDGLTLRTVVAEQGALSPSQAVHISEQICAAMHAIHEQGLVHRDLKPENILLLPDGRVKVTDVGLTSLLSETGLSKTDVMLNGVGYMSPEQARGKPVGPASDIYNMGILLFEMLTARLPFESSDAWTVVKMQAQDKPPSPHDMNPKVPIGLSRIVERALQKEPSGRFSSAAEMEAALAELPQSEGFWWHRLPGHISSREGLSPLILLAAYRRQASFHLRHIGATIKAALTRTPPSRRVLVAHYLASFLIALVILFSISAHMLDGTSGAADDNAGIESTRNIPGTDDRPSKDFIPPWALTTNISQTLNTAPENVAIDPVTAVGEGAGGVAPAGANAGGGEKSNDKGGKAKGKDDKGGEGKAKGEDKGKKKGQDNKGKGNNNGKGKGAGGKKK